MAEGKDEKGRFTPGNRYGGKSPGRPPRAVEEKLLQTLAEAIQTNGTLKDGLEKIKDGIKKGDLDYWKFVFSYLVGMPIQRQSVSLSGQEMLADWLNDLRQAEDGASDGLAEPGAETSDVAPAGG